MRIIASITTCFLLASVFIQALPAAHAQSTTRFDDKSAVIFVYHRIGEDEYPATNLRIEQFDSHIQELQNGNYNVLPVPEIIHHIKNDKTLPPKTVGISFDGGYTSTYKHAIPKLLEAELPFTLFIASDHMDWSSPKYISWDNLRDLADEPEITIGLHPASYTRMANQDRDDILLQINKAKAAFREHLNGEPALFAYPFGEYSTTYRRLISEQGFDAAFSQQSSVVYTGSDLFALPRFTMTESHGSLERFRMTANALPIPVTDIQPSDPYITSNPPRIGFSVSDELLDIKSISCFATGQPRPELEFIDQRIELRLEQKFEEDRARVNCTMPAPPLEPGEADRWRWFGMLLVVPDSIRHQQDAVAIDPAEPGALP